MTSQEKREKVVEKYRQLVKQKNIYNQSMRQYVFTSYKGKYYSDCSSSIGESYRLAGIGFTNGLGYKLANTAGIYNSLKNKVLNVTIKNGQVVDAKNVLKVGDLLMFRGTDSSRPLCIGHIEMVSKIVNGVVYCLGHGSGNPSEKVLSTYCNMRYNMKTKTKYGNRGLACVIRAIEDDNNDKIVLTKINKSSNIDDIKRLQTALNKFDVGLPKLVVDGKYGVRTKDYIIALWDSLGWNKDGKSTGWTAGEKTLKKLKLI